MGRRNYRFFYMFIVSLAFLAVFIFACAIAHLILSKYDCIIYLGWLIDCQLWLKHVSTEILNQVLTHIYYATHAKGLPPDNPETEVQTYFQIIHVCAVKFYIRRDWNVIFC